MGDSDPLNEVVKRRALRADSSLVDAAERKEILSRYMDHSRRFEAVAARRANGSAEVIPFTAPLKELEQRLFLSEETVKSHVRHLLAKLQARSRAHAVAVGFRRGLIG